MTDKRARCYKVSEITELIKDYLEGEFYSIQIEGEVSGFKISSTGHYYFTLKDKASAISAVIFQKSAKGLDYVPANGDLVVVTGNLSVYAKSGTYQVVCAKIEKAGQGDILAQLEKLKQKLAAEGLFDSDRKKPIPKYPKKIGVVTSPSGAAIRDILNVLKRRNNNIDLIIFPAPVQGDEAAHIIADQIRRAGMLKICDVLLVSRGGGAPEDLLPFSDEEVVRAIAACEIPVISAVGHEIDVVLSDFAADLRAPTPSAAAEIVSKEADNMLDRVLECKNSILENIQRRLEKVHLLLNTFSPENFQRMAISVLTDYRQRLIDAQENCNRTISDMLLYKKHKLELLRMDLEASSPDAILRKGYAAVFNRSSGYYVGNLAAVSKDDQIEIKFFDGKAEAVVTKVER